MSGWGEDGLAPRFALQHRQTDRRLSAHTELSGHELGRELAEGRELQGAGMPRAAYGESSL